MSYLQNPYIPELWEWDGVCNGKFMAKDCTLHDSAEEALKHNEERAKAREAKNSHREGG